METTNKIVIFILIITTVVAVMLTGLREATMSTALQNEDVFNKRAILSALGENLDKSPTEMSNDEVLGVFNNKMEQIALNMDGEVIEGLKAEEIDMAKERKKPEAERRLPLYIYNNAGEKFYIVSVRGNGLWDEIWGTIALKDDLNTIAGASFDHKGETPGLGAEIKDNPTFPSR
ncbi:MAG: FMN-binding protein, partial [Bacteroidota bacterium]